MAIKTGRSDKVAEVIIDHEKCTLCGLCTVVCKGAPLYIENDRVNVDHSRIFGCIGCGQCAAVCTENCITVVGRTLLDGDIADELPPEETKATYDQLKSLLLTRRSIRDFKKEEVPQDVIEKIIDAASTAPMGLPPSDVEILVLKGRDKVKQFSDDMITSMKQSKWMFGPVAQLLMRPFIKKETAELFKTFLVPMLDAFLEGKTDGKDLLLYNAPLAMYFHVSPYADSVDPLIVATYAMIAAESLGIGSCMIGTIAPFIKHNKKLKKKYAISLRNRQGIMLIFGYPKVKYKRTIKRTFADINYY
ncbi:MAG: nitroreductase family protein [Desulfobacterales bacterium]|nr:nitroreductase family protein [Desulfobacterales bacterium]